jgi:transcriptional regulator GlxA family with amidase domain
MDERAELTFGAVVFEGTEELDLIGPWEVFGMHVRDRENQELFLIGPQAGEPVRCAKRLRLVPDYGYADAPKADVLIVPGGKGVRPLLDDESFLTWLRGRCEQARWVFSICTGSGLLANCGWAAGKRVTTHWGFVETLRGLGPAEVLEDTRFVRDGQLLTAAGVSAGIDAALWLVGELESPQRARQVQRDMEYDPQPPYAPGSSGAGASRS